MNAVRAGRIAGEVAAEGIAKGDCSKNQLRVYQKRCDDSMGKRLRQSYRLKESVFKLTDDELNATAKAINRINPDKRTLGRIFITALARNPKLIPDIIALFGS
jgi:digeranylgeranylglycerophospholipid reductase